VEVATEIETVRNEQGVPTSQRRVFRLAGELLAEGQPNVSALMRSLEAALAVPYQDLILYQDDGAESATVLKNAGSLTGVICTQGPGYPSSAANEYVNQRAFTATFEAEYPLPGSGNFLTAYTETIRWWGGGPVRTVEPAVSGPPYEAILWAATAYEATQSGQATAYQGFWPVAVAPIWPLKLRQAPVIQRTSPRRKGRGLQDYSISWEYQFVSATPLIGLPHLPP
jgi:hypothetical protein